MCVAYVHEAPFKRLGPMYESRFSFPITSSSSSDTVIVNLESTVSKCTSEIVWKEEEISDTGHLSLHGLYLDL